MPCLVIGLASPSVATSLQDGLERVRRLIVEAASQGARIVCFPEAYLPGLRGLDFEVPAFDRADEELALAAVSTLARDANIAVVISIEHVLDSGSQIAAFVFNADGTLQGSQTKNQLDPSEDRLYVPGSGRRLFEIDGVKLGVVICHEGWRYPETVRWAGARGAKIVFHPQHTGRMRDGVRLAEWGSTAAPYYERAMMMRSIENTIYFASVNYALPFQESATTLIAPSGRCQAHLPYGQEGVLVQTIDLDAATGLLAQRFAPERF